MAAVPASGAATFRRKVMGDCNGCGHPALFCACSQARDIDTSVCDPHPDAPHGFDRNGSHDLDRYVCTCEFWEAPEESDNPQPVSQTDRTMGDSVSGSAHLRDRIAAAAWTSHRDRQLAQLGMKPSEYAADIPVPDWAYAIADAVIAELGRGEKPCGFRPIWEADDEDE